MVTPLRVAFFGTPMFALATLERLTASAHHTVLVVTQPDRPRGRGHHVVSSPVKVFAGERGIPVLQPERLREPAFLETLAGYDLDLAVVAAYGRILPAALLTVPRLGMINVHASLLPRWRGAAPVHRAVIAGDKETGVTIMRVVPALDAGPMLARVRVDIGPHETSAVLESRLAALGADLLVATADQLAAGPIPESPQPEEGVTYAKRLERSESRVDWNQPASDIHNRIRGLQPWPVATVMLRGRRLRLLGSVPEELGHRVSLEMTKKPGVLTPGTVVSVDEDGFVVACRPGAVRIVRVQLEGRAPAAVREFLHGHQLSVGDTLEPLPIET